MLSLLLSLTMLALEPCLVVEGPQIQAQDLAAQLAIFATLAPATALAASPNFGVRRDISSQTLRLWAMSHALPESQFDPVCIYRRAAVVEAANQAVLVPARNEAKVVVAVETNDPQVAVLDLV